MGKARGRGIRPYAVFLRALQDELLDALADLENLGFHHMDEGSAEFQHFLRIATWCDEVNTRMWMYDSGKERKLWNKVQAIPGAAPPSALVDPETKQYLGGGHTNGDRPRLNDGGHQEGNDSC